MLRFEKSIGATTTVIGSIVLCLMAVQIVVDVTMRNVLGTGFPATSELVSKYFMLVVSFLPVAYAELERRHIEASVFTDLMPDFTRPAVNLLGFVLSFIVYAFLTYGTAAEAARQTSRKSYVETGLTDFYTWPGYWILPICFGLMTIVLGLRVFQVLTGKFHPQDHLLLETHDNSEV
ncbi:MAG: C4-dicarboxylate ABC transporter [Robiginitomaculum sp.]|nr:MAG: C4-dicarboxylate ABC transporter [Robiginitomaculum sp.]